jgi:serpin B
MRLHALIPTLVVLFVSCAAPPVEPPGEVASSDKQRLTTAAPGADLTAAVASNSDFAFDLYRQLKGAPSDNLFISPQSISVALSMAYAGSAGTTKSAFEQVLHQRLAESAYHRAMNDLDRQLTSRGQGAQASDGQPFRLRMANQLFAERNFGFETPFLDTLAQEYGANVRLMDFVAQPDPARVSINQWVEQKTEDRIKDLLSPGTITPETRAVLVNAIYFNAAWETQFEPNATRAAPFHNLSGTTTSVQMMNDSAIRAKGATVNGVEVVSLPYDGNELSMVVLMPPAGSFETFEQNLTAASLETHLAALRSEQLELSLPKFELRTNKSLSKSLIDLGLGAAFGTSGDFSRMSTEAQLGISDVVHQSFVKVSETGTEAAAATAVIIGVTSVPQTRPVVIDRPFVFAIRDDATGAIVFLGRVVSL